MSSDGCLLAGQRRGSTSSPPASKKGLRRVARGRDSGPEELDEQVGGPRDVAGLSGSRGSGSRIRCTSAPRSASERGVRTASSGELLPEGDAAWLREVDRRQFLRVEHVENRGAAEKVSVFLGERPRPCLAELPCSGPLILSASYTLDLRYELYGDQAGAIGGGRSASTAPKHDDVGAGPTSGGHPLGPVNSRARPCEDGELDVTLASRAGRALRPSVVEAPVRRRPGRDPSARRRCRRRSPRREGDSLLEKQRTLARSSMARRPLHGSPQRLATWSWKPTILTSGSRRGSATIDLKRCRVAQRLAARRAQPPATPPEAARNRRNDPCNRRARRLSRLRSCRPAPVLVGLWASP